MTNKICVKIEMKMANIRQLSKELQLKAIDELNEDVSRIPDDIQAIREWLQQKKYISARTDDQFILTFLRGCKFSLERTKEKLEAFYTIRTLLPELFKNRNPSDPEIQEALKAGVFLPVYNQGQSTTPRFFMYRSSAFDPQKVKTEVLAKVQTMITDILLIEDDRMAISGMHMLLQAKDLTMSHCYPPALLMKLIKYMQEGAPTRTKGFHLINMHPIFTSLLNFAISLLNNKVKQRLFVYNTNNLEKFYKAIPKEDLPKDFGGDGPRVQELIDFWKEKVESYAEWYKEDEKYGTDEKRRPGKPKTTQEMFGVEGVNGSFRKINVD